MASRTSNSVGRLLSRNDTPDELCLEMLLLINGVRRCHVFEIKHKGEIIEIVKEFKLFARIINGEYVVSIFPLPNVITDIYLFELTDNIPSYYDMTFTGTVTFRIFEGNTKYEFLNNTISSSDVNLRNQLRKRYKELSQQWNYVLKKYDDLMTVEMTETYQPSLSELQIRAMKCDVEFLLTNRMT